MASDPQLELRVSRLENDTAAIYEMLGALSETQQEHSRSFDGIDGRLDGIDRRLDGMDDRFDRMDDRFDRMDDRFDAIDGRFDRMDEQLQGLATTLVEVVRRLPEPS